MRLFSYAIKDNNIIITPKKINNISKMSSSYLQFNSHRLDLALSLSSIELEISDFMIGSGRRSQGASRTYRLREEILGEQTGLMRQPQ